jgi:hypothetical protein
MSRIQIWIMFSVLAVGLVSQFNNCSLANGPSNWDSNASSTVLPSATPVLAISPTTVSTSVGGMITFNVAGGVPPYQFTVTSGNGSIVSVVSTMEAVFTAPSVSGPSTVQVQDSQNNTAVAQVTVTAAAISTFVLSPMLAMVNPGATVVFVIRGGTAPYKLTTSSGSLTGNTLTAGPEGVTTVTATDSSSTPLTQQAVITVSAPPQPVTINLVSPLGCGGHYCSCQLALNTPNPANARAICVAKGYTTMVSFTTQAGPVNASQCLADGTSCYTKQNSGNVVCSTVTCQ